MMEKSATSRVSAVRSSQPRTIAGFTLIELLVVLAAIVILIAFLMPVTRSTGEPTRRSQCKNNLKQITLALHNYAEAYKSLPPAYTVDSSGRPLHSWRTLILPFIDQGPLYNSIDLSKAWDDPANAAACKTAPAVYRCPSGDHPADHTTYLAVVTPSSGIRPKGSRAISEITDPAGQTLLVIEVHPKQSVHWMSPIDADEELVLAFGPHTALPHAGGPHAALADGSVRQVPASMPAEARRARVSVAGNDNAPDDEW